MNKLLSTVILILLAAPFQPAMGQVGITGEPLPILLHSNGPASENQALLEMIQKAGLGSQAIGEADFASAMKISRLPFLVVPVGGLVSDATLAALNQYVAAGGKLLLLPTVPPAGLVGNPLLALTGISVSGVRVLGDDTKLQWQGQMAEISSALPKGNSVLTFAPLHSESVLAVWGDQYPAVVQTAKGVFFNGQWGKQLPEPINLSALIPVLSPVVSKAAEKLLTQQAQAATPHLTAPSVQSPAPAVIAVTPDQTPAGSGLMVVKQAGTESGKAPANESVNPTEAEPTASEKTLEKQESSKVAIEHPTPVTPSSADIGQVPENHKMTRVAAEPLKAGSVEKPATQHEFAKLVESIKQVLAMPPKTASRPAVEVVKETISKTDGSAPPVEEQKAEASVAVEQGPAVKPEPAVTEKQVAVPSPEKTEVAKPVANVEPPASPAKSDDVHDAVAAAPANPVPEKANEPEKIASMTPAPVPAATEQKPSTPAKEAPKTAVGDDEVLNNILGVPNTPSSSKTPTTGPASEHQKPFSFLDPEASSVLAPTFDYGTYSMNMRILEDYRKRITDALETSKQISLNIPQDQVMSLLNESDAHKKQFGDLYLNHQTEAGLNEFSQARKLSLQALALTTVSPRVEGRAIWLDRGTIVKAGGPAGIKLLMQRLHQAGMNVVYFEALNAGFPMYQSAVLKQNPMVQGWDPLQAAVDEGHRLGMEVHAWVWVFAVGNTRHNELIGKAHTYAGPILEDNGLMGESLRGKDGSLNMDPRQHEFWLSPASPKGREFLLSAYREIITKYPVDGLHLDYIRYPFQTGGTRMGFESVGRERFTQSTGMNLDSLDDYTLRMWIAWKTYQVSSFVQQVSEMVRSTRPEVKISAAVFPMKREARIVAIQQDWETWVDNGWIDMLNPMSYTSDPERLQEIFEYVQHSPQKHVLFYPGISMKYLDGASLATQVEALRQKGCLGSTLFAGAYLDGEKVDILGKGLYKNPNSLPPHRNVLQSLQALNADYGQKLGQLQSNGGIDAAAANKLQATLSQLSGILNGLSGPDAAKIRQAQQVLQNLQVATQDWTNRDKTAHPFRAAYFDTLMLQLDELMGYLADKSVPPTTSEAFAQAKKMLQPAASAVPAVNPVDAEGPKKPAAVMPNQPSAVAQPLPVTTAN